MKLTLHDHLNKSQWFYNIENQKSIHSLMLEKKIMAYVHQLLDQPSQWQTSKQAGPC